MPLALTGRRVMGLDLTPGVTTLTKSQLWSWHAMWTLLPSVASMIPMTTWNPSKMMSRITHPGAKGIFPSLVPRPSSRAVDPLHEETYFFPQERKAWGRGYIFPMSSWSLMTNFPRPASLRPFCAVLAIRSVSRSWSKAQFSEISKSINQELLYSVDECVSLSSGNVRDSTSVKLTLSCCHFMLLLGHPATATLWS